MPIAKNPFDKGRGHDFLEVSRANFRLAYFNGVIFTKIYVNNFEKRNWEKTNRFARFSLFAEILSNQTVFPV